MRRFLIMMFVGCIVQIPLFVLIHAWWHLFFVWALACFLFLYPILTPNCGCFGPVVTCFRTDKREVWLTIDEGPHRLNTPRILNLLEKYQANATFFVIN
jgi:peptidoglycan-N-acetylglucosamine deacetylase